jgi:hypothetical protein
MMEYTRIEYLCYRLIGDDNFTKTEGECKAMKSRTMPPAPASESAIDDQDSPMDKAIAATFAAMDVSDEMDLTRAERSAIQTKLIVSAILGVDVDGVIDGLTRRPGQPRINPLKIVKSNDVIPLLP